MVTLRDMSRARNFSYIDADVRCVQWHSPRLATEELEDPGIAIVYADLMSHGGRNTYSARLPKPLRQVTFGQIQEALGRRFTTTVLAVQDDGAVINPGWDAHLPESAVLYYVGERRLSAEEFSSALAQQPKVQPPAHKDSGPFHGRRLHTPEANTSVKVHTSAAGAANCASYNCA